MSEMEIRVADALVLKPGDRVLLMTTRLMSRMEMDEARGRLAGLFPGVTFAFGSGIESAAVLRDEVA